MPYIFYNAIHEAGHALIACRCGFDVDGVFVNDRGLATTRVSYDPSKTIPAMVYCQKIAGSIAVEIQNEREQRKDDAGFGSRDNPEHDAWTAAKVIAYLQSIAPGFDPEFFETTWRQWVRERLLEQWGTVESLATEIARAFTSKTALPGARIREIVKPVP